MEIHAPKTLYSTWASNEAGASTELSKPETSVAKAKKAARAEFGSGWTIHVVRMDIFGAQEEVGRFTIRKAV